MQQDNVIQLNLTESNAKQIIAEIVKDSSRVLFTEHARKRMRQRKITDTQVIRCIKHGGICEGPFRSPNGNWQLSLNTVSAGDPLTVCVALDRDTKGNNIIVITTYC